MPNRIRHSFDTVSSAGIFVWGLVIEMSPGTMMYLGGALLWLILTLVHKLSLVRASTRKAFVDAENASLKPQVDSLRKDVEKSNRERAELRERIRELETEDRIKGNLLVDLAMAAMENRGVVKRDIRDEPITDPVIGRG